MSNPRTFRLFDYYKFDPKDFAWSQPRVDIVEGELYRSLYDKYNTVAVSLQNPLAFHADVKEAARRADDTEHFHALMAENTARRRKELNSALDGLMRNYCMFGKNAFDVIGPGDEGFLVLDGVLRHASLDNLIHFMSRFYERYAGRISWDRVPLWTFEEGHRPEAKQDEEEQAAPPGETPSGETPSEETPADVVAGEGGQPDVSADSGDATAATAGCAATAATAAAEDDLPGEMLYGAQEHTHRWDMFATDNPGLEYISKAEVDKLRAEMMRREAQPWTPETATAQPAVEARPKTPLPSIDTTEAAAATPAPSTPTRSRGAHSESSHAVEDRSSSKRKRQSDDDGNLDGRTESTPVRRKRHRSAANEEDETPPASP